MHVGLRKGDEFRPLEINYCISNGLIQKLDSPELIEVKDKHLLLNFVKLGKGNEQMMTKQYDDIEVINILVDDKMTSVDDI